jgi:hypothetical protein
LRGKRDRNTCGFRKMIDDFERPPVGGFLSRALWRRSDQEQTKGKPVVPEHE